MPVYSRENISTLLKEISESPARVYLLFGERYLCRDAAKQIEQQLLSAGGTNHPLDGEREDISQLAGKFRSYSLFPGRQLYSITDTRVFHSKNVAETIWKRAVKAHEAGKPDKVVRALHSLLLAAQIEPDSESGNLENLPEADWKQLFGFGKPKNDLSWTTSALAVLQVEQKSTPQASRSSEEVLLELLKEGIPSCNFLLLLAEEVDKRKKLYKYLKEHHVVLDLSVEVGASSRAKKSQRKVLLQLASDTLQKWGKTAAPKVIDELIDRVGFYPVALVMELEKVILFLDDRPQITLKDIDIMVGRTRQDALFELTSAITQRRLDEAVTLSSRLMDNGIYPLAIIATLRNAIRSLLLYHSLQEQPQYRYSKNLSAAVFQNQCLPLLKENEQWQQELKGHPFALYMQFKTAAQFSLFELKRWMRLLLKAEMRLKSSSVSADCILLDLFTSLLVQK